MVDSAAGLARSLAKAGKAIETAQRDAVARAALASKRTIEAERDRATGGDGRLSGVGKRGAKLGVRFDLKDTEAVVRATGPWQLIERDTKSAGIIRPKSRRRGRRRAGGAKALAGGGFGPYGAVRDKGTTGKKPFEKGAKRSRRPVAKQMRGAFSKAVARSF